MTLLDKEDFKVRLKIYLAGSGDYFSSKIDYFGAVSEINLPKNPPPSPTLPDYVFF